MRILVLAMLLGACGPAALIVRPRDEFRAHAIPFVSLELTAAMRRVLDELPGLTQRRVVLLGAPDPYIHEKYDYQLLFVRYLFEHGTRFIGFEMDRSLGERLDRYLETGDETLLHLPSKSSPREITSGVWQLDENAEWSKNDGRERERFMRALRELNESREPGSPPLHAFGFDGDTRALDDRLGQTNGKFVLIGDDMHLGKDGSSIRLGDAQTGRTMGASIGDHLAHTLGGELFGVWMLYAKGRHGAIGCREDGCAIEPPQGVIEQWLAEIGPRLLVPIDAAARRPTPLFEERRFIHDGQLGSGIIGRQADVVLFVEEVHPPSR